MTELCDQTSLAPTKAAKIIGELPTRRKDLDYGSAVSIATSPAALSRFEESKLGEFEEKSARAVTAIVQQAVTTANKAETYVSVATGGTLDCGILNLLTAATMNITARSAFKNPTAPASSLFIARPFIIRGGR